MSDIKVSLKSGGYYIEEVSEEELEMANDMMESLMEGTFYSGTEVFIDDK